MGFLPLFYISSFKKHKSGNFVFSNIVNKLSSRYFKRVVYDYIGQYECSMIAVWMCRVCVCLIFDSHQIYVIFMFLVYRVVTSSHLVLCHAIDGWSSDLLIYNVDLSCDS